jgi:hypothetical protein
MLLVIAASAALALTVGAQSAQSASYKTCSLSERDQDPPGPIPTYNLSVKTQGASCTTAKKVAKAFHKCRPAAGYLCTKKVLSIWKCTGKKDSSTPLLFYASFTCKAGTKRVKSSYQQNT